MWRGVLDAISYQRWMWSKIRILKNENRTGDRGDDVAAHASAMFVYCLRLERTKAKAKAKNIVTSHLNYNKKSSVTREEPKTRILLVHKLEDHVLVVDIARVNKNEKL